MFKNLIVHRIDPAWSSSLQQIDNGLQAGRFTPCLPTQAQSSGWVAPRGTPHAPLVESVGGQWLMNLVIERKALPSAVVKRRADELARAVEETRGHPPGRRERKELKEQAALELLPQAFTKRSSLAVWIDPKRGLLMVDASSSTRAGEVLTHLVRAVDGLAAKLLQTTESAGVAMADWLLTGEPPAGFSIDRDCELKAEDEMKSVVRYARHPLDIDEVRQHIATGKRPTRLALTWQGRVSFVLTEQGVLRKIEFVEGKLTGQASPGRGEADDPFDANAAIATGELGRLLPDLIDALGGELSLAAAAAVPGAALKEPATA